MTLSASSWLVPERVDGDLAAATTAVAEGTLFAFVDVLDRPAWQAETAAWQAQPWLSGAVAFSGPAQGTLHVVLPAALARDLAGAMLGTEGDVPEPQLDDLVGEMANMICGGWLSARAPHVTFDLAAPSVQRRPSLEGTVPAADHTAWLAINGSPVAVTLAVTTPLG